jgi:hypothetical protein
LTDLPPWDTLLGWVTEGQQLTEHAAGRLDPAALRGPSRLDG